MIVQSNQEKILIYAESVNMIYIFSFITDINSRDCFTFFDILNNNSVSSCVGQVNERPACGDLVYIMNISHPCDQYRRILGAFRHRIQITGRAFFLDWIEPGMIARGEKRFPKIIAPTNTEDFQGAGNGHFPHYSGFFGVRKINAIARRSENHFSDLLIG
jgi:hypothetical protein